MYRLRQAYVLAVCLLALVAVTSFAYDWKQEGGDCQEDGTGCHRDAVCAKTKRTTRCRCKQGFYGNGKICIDENECEYDNGGCSHFCQNIHSNYTCSCRDGFRLAPDRHDCLDRDECKINNGGCQHVCLNTLGSYECRCLQGYSLAADGKQCHAGPSSCYDVHGCQHYCKKTPAGIRCGCRDGYKLHSDGKRCLQTCQNGNGGCQHKCSESPHGPVCSCHPKYILRPDDKSCIASCRVNNGGCDKKCDDTPQGPVCSCPPGFILNKDSKTCSDVDECATNNGQCSHQCINAHGSYECVCPAGYRLHSDQMTCVDIDECEDNTTCHSGCVNTPGSYTCVCLPGYEKYGETHCADVNECAVHNGGCAQTCDNIDGSFRCSCSTGFRLHQNGKDCVETSRCAPVKSKSNILIESCQRNVSTSTEICVARCTHSHLSTPVPVTTTVTADRHRDRFLMTCGPHTAFTWINNVTNSTVVTCSAALTAPGLSRRAEVVFHTVDCGGPDRQARDMLHRSLLHAVTTFNRKNINCGGECVIQNVDVQCDNDTRRSPRPSRSKTQAILTANFHIQVKPVTPTASCDLDCSRKLTKKRLKRTIHILRQSITDDDLYTNVVPGQKFVVNSRSFKAHKAEELCGVGHMLTTDTCVPCSAGSFFEVAEGTCKSCPPGTYQPLEGQVTCLICPNMAATHGVGIEGASDVTDCKLGCEVGTYSESGFQPCEPCALGTYQPEQGRTYCLSCGKGIPTRRRQATGFHDCVVKERCRPGSYYDKVKGECVLCAKNTYQPQSGQDVCFRCPGNTETDGEGATNSSFCKDRQCGGHIGQYQGYIQTPNWPGYYPNNAECTWSLSAEKGRRILIIVPEIHLAAEDKCGDMLVLRKSASPYSVTTFETCESSDTPIAVTSRTRALWVRFKTDGSHTARGFSIPYVSYSEEYQELIEDIVRDGRLYSSHKHQQVLKDRKLLSSLLEVIAEPYKYFQYANSSSTMFPDSFIRLLRNKVLRFFT